MGVKFFGQFLLEQGVISGEQLLATTQLQDTRNQPLGAIAIEKGYVSAAQAEEINRRQKFTDRRFGELALELGLMTEAQIKDVLDAQRSRRIRIGEALVQLGFISDDALATQLNSFTVDQAPYEAARVQLPPGTPQAEFVGVAIDLTEKLLLRMGGLAGKRGVVVANGPERPSAALLTVLIPFSGALRVDYTASASQDVATAIAKRMLGSAVALSDELVIDALKEFCNVVCGNVCGKLSHVEHPVEIGPPSEGAAAISDSKKSILVPIHIPDGRFELRLHFH